MKKILLLSIICSVFIACNPIPNKSIFEELTQEELETAVKSDSLFAELYEFTQTMHKLVDFPESQKVYFKNLTYRRLHKYMCYRSDSIYWAQWKKKQEEEWENTFGKDLDIVKDTVKYWENHSLSRFAKVELSNFSYIKPQEAYIHFKITPLMGSLERIEFIFQFDDDFLVDISQHYIYSDPIHKTIEGAWRIDPDYCYVYKDITASEFSQMYDWSIMITNIRKNGVDYSILTLGIPQEILAILREWTPENEEAVAKLFNPSYMSRDTYIQNKFEEELRDYDSLCYEFFDYIDENL